MIEQGGGVGTGAATGREWRRAGRRSFLPALPQEQQQSAGKGATEAFSGVEVWTDAGEDLVGGARPGRERAGGGYASRGRENSHGARGRLDGGGSCRYDTGPGHGLERRRAAGGKGCRGCGTQDPESTRMADLM